MKEVHIDWETYEAEKQEIKDKGIEFALMEIARWLEGKDTLQSCMAYRKDNKKKYLIRIAKALGREEELVEEFKKEEAA